MNQVWVTGDAVVDLIPSHDNALLKCPGGAPANVAVAIAKLSGKSAFFGRVGKDPFGDFMNSTLLINGVNTEFLIKDPSQRTSTVIVDLDEHGERDFTFMVKPSADQFMTLSDLPSFNQGEWLHVCSISLANEPSRSSTIEAIRRIKSLGGYVSFDPNLREEVWQNQSEIESVVMKVASMADVLKFSEEELLKLTNSKSLEEGLQKVATKENTLILVTQGAKGVWCTYDNQQTLFRGRVLTPVDTTGAGDAFVGGLLAYLSRHSQWKESDIIFEAIKWASGCGALATTQKGAMTALPSMDELLTFINE
ncbi:aminoimidazole riboside kinase [Photobacterium angustum]|uniref:aminoimidazole riboside kinase n=1 Tax=Photobacterium angustum TaxID=661 RepID=UPI0005E98B97|nr:aminoimidazole riboside kinase [Photobacterium angustum]KJF95919.1 fructokinase [Photobacterium angustum]PSW80131.1 aminoimidazole riboside kinase [Photobacterium angustum]